MIKIKNIIAGAEYSTRKKVETDYVEIVHKMKLQDLKNIPADDFDDEEEELKTKVLIGLTAVAAILIFGFILVGYLVVNYQF